MLAARLLFYGRRADQRPVASILDAAADRLKRPRQPAIANNLAANDIEWAWQLMELDERDWEALAVPIGLKTACKAELASPSTNIASAEPAASEIDERKRRFLLLPDALGQPAKPLSEYSALFLGLMATPIADRQTLMLTLCELMALVSGLFLPIPLEFRRSASPAAPGVAKGLDVAPTLADGMDALMVFIFVLNVLITFASVVMAMGIASGAYHADDRFCMGAMSAIGSLVVGFFFGVLYPTNLLALWHVFTDAASPYTAIGGVILFTILGQLIFTFFWNFVLEHLALEIYHWPRWTKMWFILSSPWHRRLFADEVLGPKAEERAAKLRAQLGLNSQPDSAA